MLLRMVGRFSCSSVQKVWSSEMKETLRGIAAKDCSDWVRQVSEVVLDGVEYFNSDDSIFSLQEASDVLEEYKHLSFYSQC